MKKRILLIIMTVILALGVTFTACAKTDNDLSDVDYVGQSYAVAVEKGFDGTLEEWIELLKGERARTASRRISWLSKTQAFRVRSSSGWLRLKEKRAKTARTVKTVPTV